MSHEFMQKVRFQAGTPAAPVDFTAAAGVALRFDPQTPIDVYRIGVIPTTAFSGTQAIVQVRTTTPIGGSPVVYATVTFPAVMAVGTLYYADILVPVAQAAGDDSLTVIVPPIDPDMPRSLIDVDPKGPLLVDVGSELDLRRSQAATTGAGILFVEYVEHDGNGLRFKATSSKVTTIA